MPRGRNVHVHVRGHDTSFGVRVSRSAGWPWGLLPRAPTDPYVQVSRIRFLKQPLRFTTYVMNSLMLSAGLALTRDGSTMPPMRFRPTVWLLGAPLPIPRVLAVQVPRLRRYYRGTTTSCRPSRLPSSSFVGRYHSSARLSLALRPSAAAGGSPGVGHPVSPAGNRQWRRQDLPCSWGTSIVPLPCSPTPADRTRQAIATRRHGPHSDHKEGYRDEFSRLNHTALALAVYALPDGSPHRDTRLASGCWPSSTGRACYPQGSDERFSMCVTRYSPFPSSHGARSGLKYQLVVRA